MQDNQEVLNAIFLLINKQKVKQAKLLMDGISQSEFIDALRQNDNKIFTDEMHTFVMEFDKVNWSKYITFIPDEKIEDFLEYAKKNKIDLLKPNTYKNQENLTLLDNNNKTAFYHSVEEGRSTISDLIKQKAKYNSPEGVIPKFFGLRKTQDKPGLKNT